VCVLAERARPGPSLPLSFLLLFKYNLTIHLTAEAKNPDDKYIFVTVGKGCILSDPLDLLSCDSAYSLIWKYNLGDNLASYLWTLKPKER
jgi:hypothetical protein